MRLLPSSHATLVRARSPPGAVLTKANVAVNTRCQCSPVPGEQQLPDRPSYRPTEPAYDANSLPGPSLPRS